MKPVRITKTRKSTIKSSNDSTRSAQVSESHEYSDVTLDDTHNANANANANIKKTRLSLGKKPSAKIIGTKCTMDESPSVSSIIDKINQSLPLVFSLVNDPVKIICMIITKDKNRIKSAIFKTINGDIYVNSEGSTFNFIIPEIIPIDNMITYLIELKDKYPDITVNFYKSNDLYCFKGNTSIIKTEIDKITPQCTKVKYYHSCTDESNVAHDFVIDCICVLKTNNMYSGFEFEFDHGRLYAVIDRETNSLNLYNDQHSELFLIRIMNDKTLRMYSSIEYMQNYFTVVATSVK